MPVRAVSVGNMHLVKGKSIKEIARDMKILRRDPAIHSRRRLIFDP
jgi:hypothetical protein